MKNIDLIIELNKSLLEEKRRDLALLLNEESRLENQITKLDQNLIKEQDFSRLNKDSIFYYDNFAKFIKFQKKDLNEKLSKIQLIVLKAREHVNESFLELRKFEITNDELVKKEQIELARKEQSELDEISINMFSRKNNY